MKRFSVKKWARLAAVVAVLALLLVLPIQQYTAYGQGYGYGDGQPPATTGGSTGGATTSGGVFTTTVSFKSDDQNLTVLIPRNTVGKTKGGDPLPEVRITAVPVPPTPPQNNGFIGLNYDLEPDGATFDPPIIITFTYNPSWLPAGIGPENLTIGYYDTDAEEWVMLGASDIIIDPKTNTISARVSHFTYYSVMAHIAPAKFTVSGLTVPSAAISIAEKAEISAKVANTGDVAGTYTVTLKINGVVAASKRVTLAGGESTSVSFTTVQGKAGDYKIELDGQTATLTVKETVLKPVVVTPTVTPVTVPAPAPAPTAPAVPAAPAPVPAPIPWMAIIIALVVTAIVAGIIIWYFGFHTA